MGWSCENLSNIKERLGQDLPITSVQLTELLLVNRLLFTQGLENNPFPSTSMPNNELHILLTTYYSKNGLKTYSILSYYNNPSLVLKLGVERNKLMNQIFWNKFWCYKMSSCIIMKTWDTTSALPQTTDDSTFSSDRELMRQVTWWIYLRTAGPVQSRLPRNKAAQPEEWHKKKSNAGETLSADSANPHLFHCDTEVD